MRAFLSRLAPLLYLLFTIGCCANGGIGMTGVAAAQSVPANSEMGDLEKGFRTATALLYGQTEDGGYVMLCTATAYEKNGETYRFVTAAHCVAEDDSTHEHVDVSPNNWYLSFEDDPNNKMFVGATLLRAGYQSRGDDFAVLEAKLPKPISVVPLAKNDPSLGEEFVNFASPGGYGKQLFHGWVSSEKIERPIIERDINWKGAVFLQAQAAPGSSGSAIVSKRQKGIIAFLVGMVGGRGTPNIVAIQVSKFKKFNEMAEAGKYKWYKPADDGSGSGSGVKSGMLPRIWTRIHGDGAAKPIFLPSPVAPNPY